MSSVGTAKKPAPVIRTVVPGNRTLEEIYEDEAREIVDEAIDNARLRLSVYAGGAKESDVPDVKDDEPTIDPETGYEIPNIKWMTSENFTVAGGLEQIEEFIQVRGNGINLIVAVVVRGSLRLYIGKERKNA